MMITLLDTGLTVGALAILSAGGLALHRLLVRTVLHIEDDATTQELAVVPSGCVADDDTAELAATDDGQWALEYAADLAALNLERRETAWREQVVREAYLRRHTPADAEELDILARLEVVCLDLADKSITDAYLDACEASLRRFRDRANDCIDTFVTLQLTEAELSPWETLTELGFGDTGEWQLVAAETVGVR